MQVDLKSRRELCAVHGRPGALEVVWFDQAVVRAALGGRVLILEGLEKAGNGTGATEMARSGDMMDIFGDLFGDMFGDMTHVSETSVSLDRSWALGLAELMVGP